MKKYERSKEKNNRKYSVCNATSRGISLYYTLTHSSI